MFPAARTVLQGASDAGHVAIVRALLDAGADKLRPYSCPALETEGPFFKSFARIWLVFTDEVIFWSACVVFLAALYGVYASLPLAEPQTQSAGPRDFLWARSMVLSLKASSLWAPVLKMLL